MQGNNFVKFVDFSKPLLSVIAVIVYNACMNPIVNNECLPRTTNKHVERIEKALSIAVAYGGTDGAHHKDWVIDQMVRALTGCPVKTTLVTSSSSEPYEYQAQGESEDYKALVAEACNGEDGPQTYSWETGSPP